MLEEASFWFARMRAPDAEQHRAAFEHWLKLGAAHRGAYNRAGEIFAVGKFLAEEAKGSSANGAEEQPAANDDAPSRWRYAAMVACLFVVVGLGAWFSQGILSSFILPKEQLATVPNTSAVAAADRKVFSTRSGKRDMVRLADGSTVTLEGGSALVALFDSHRRELRLQTGRARFEVAHESRPFIVFAGDGSVTARGTIFDVIVGQDNLVTVRLLRGAVDVERPSGPGSAGKASQPAVTRLAPGEELSFGLAAIPDLTAAPRIRAETSFATPLSTPILKEFDRAPLSEVIAEASRSSGIAIRAGDSGVGSLAVSGRFRVDDPEQVAERLASLFDLKVDHTRQDEIVLRAK